MWGWKEDNEFEEVDSTELDAGVKAETLGESSGVIHTEEGEIVAVLQGAGFTEKGTQQEEKSFEDRAMVKGQEYNHVTEYVFT